MSVVRCYWIEGHHPEGVGWDKLLVQQPAAADGGDGKAQSACLRAGRVERSTQQIKQGPTRTPQEAYGTSWHWEVWDDTKTRSGHPTSKNANHKCECEEILQEGGDTKMIVIFGTWSVKWWWMPIKLPPVDVKKNNLFRHINYIKIHRL